MSERQGLIIDFDTEHLPYLGIWLCYGGWPDRTVPKQVAVALEPTTSPCGTLAEAEAAGLTPLLLPGKQLRWNIKVELSQQNVEYATFVERVHAAC